MSLKDSKTEQNLKDAFAGESQANRRYLYFASKADVEGYNDVLLCFDQLQKGKRATRMATSSILRKQEILQRVCPSAVLPTILKPLSRARLMSTPICIRYGEDGS